MTHPTATAIHLLARAARLRTLYTQARIREDQAAAALQAVAPQQDPGHWEASLIFTPSQARAVAVLDAAREQTQRVARARHTALRDAAGLLAG